MLEAVASIARWCDRTHVARVHNTRATPGREIACSGPLPSPAGGDLCLRTQTSALGNFPLAFLPSGSTCSTATLGRRTAARGRGTVACGRRSTTRGRRTTTLGASALDGHASTVVGGLTVRSVWARGRDDEAMHDRRLRLEDIRSCTDDRRPRADGGRPRADDCHPRLEPPPTTATRR